MDILLENIGKRFRREWIFRKIDYRISTGEKLALRGPNGSGKSTLMKLLSSHLTPSKGKISFQLNGRKLSVDEVYKSVSFAAPYIEMVEEFSLEEAINFQKHFKPFRENLKSDEVIALTGLKGARTKFIREFSSGMKQRVKLALAICADSPLLLLDEPGTNLDRQGVEWYLDLMKRFTTGRTIIVASNVEEDFSFCDKQINILEYKK